MQKCITHIIFILFFAAFGHAQTGINIRTQVLVIGGGTSGTAAGIQAARLGASTIIAEPTPWLGGMLSAAGVAATDGNHKLPSGIWKEFRDKIYQVYGGPKAVETGWVSNTQFEPHVADSIFKAMAKAEKKLTVYHKWNFYSVIKKGNKVIAALFKDENQIAKIIYADIIIDATELGDVLATAKIPYDVGMEAGTVSGENVGVIESNNIIQDLTYVAVLKDFGTGTNNTIAKPENYTPAEFDGACTDYYIDKTKKAPNVDAKKMLDYGKLPNDKYMLNWPNKGNDTYLNIIDLPLEQRQIELQKAKQTTLRFVYFIQTQLGFKNLGLANEFGTADKLALIPYHREGRRVKGLVRLNINNIAKPFEGDALYRTGIAVGDYPIDHHHKKNETAPQHLEFFAVPSYNIPLGALIPEKVDGIIIAEKGISVSNVVNGSTRLQPVVMLTGQAAGVLAALSVLQKKQPRQVLVRDVQNTVLNAGAYLMPYVDIPPDYLHFKAIQKIGATGILRGTGIPFKWANQTWFYPDSTIYAESFSKDAEEFYGKKFSTKNELVTTEDLCKYILEINKSIIKKQYGTLNMFVAITKLKIEDITKPIKRYEAAVLIDYYLKPFETKPINHKGSIQNKKTK